MKMDYVMPQILEMGQASGRGEAVSEKGEAILTKAEAAYEAMTDTSDNFRAAMAGNMTELRQAKQQWIQVNGPLATALATAEKAVKTARTAAAARIVKEAKAAKTPAPTKDALAAEIEKDAAVIEATKVRDAAKAAQDAERAKVLATMKKVFAPWVKQLEGEVTTWQGVEVDEVKAKKAVVDKATKREELLAVLHHPPLAVIWDVAALEQLQKVDQLKAAMKKRLAELSDPKYAKGEIGVRTALIDRLTKDANKVFGVVSKGRIALDVNNPAVMQILERGFARHDELRELNEDDKQKWEKDPKSVGPLREVFNKEFISAMMRFGFSPGASWSTVDTMHFDFLDGLASVNSSLKMGGDYGPKP
jgi:hypothetical protein